MARTYYFSHPASVPRRKIQAIIATQKGEPDEMCPESLEETRYWCIVKRKKTETEAFKQPGLS